VSEFKGEGDGELVEGRRGGVLSMGIGRLRVWKSGGSGTYV